jgi:hypothetical protein
MERNQVDTTCLNLSPEGNILIKKAQMEVKSNLARLNFKIQITNEALIYHKKNITYHYNCNPLNKRKILREILL